MKTCDECIHGHLCIARQIEKDMGIKLNINDCGSFKDKSKFIELPCSIGDYCIWHDDLWYVNNITYCCDGSFLLWMSMADKSPCGAEAISSDVEFISKEEAKKRLEDLNYDNVSK